MDTAESLVPFTAPYAMSRRGDVTRERGFRGLFACFEAMDGPFMGLFALADDTVYRRSGRAWQPVRLKLAELQTRASVEVSYRFIRGFDQRETSSQVPWWELAQQMRIGPV